MQYDVSYFSGPTYPNGYKFDATKRAITEAYYNLLYAMIGTARVGKVVDVGCGFGFFLKICDEKGWETFGADISKYACSVAACVTEGDIVCASAEDCLPFRDCSFDVVTSFETIEHMTRPKRYVTELKRILRPGGLLFLDTPNRQSLGKIILRSNWPGYMDPTHTRVFTPQEINGLLLTCGFVDVETETRCFPYLMSIQHSAARAQELTGNRFSDLTRAYRMARVPLNMGEFILAYAWK